MIDLQGFIHSFSFLCCYREITAELERLTHTLEKLHNKMAGKHDEVVLTKLLAQSSCLVFRPLTSYVNVKCMYVLVATHFMIKCVPYVEERDLLCINPPPLISSLGVK